MKVYVVSKDDYEVWIDEIFSTREKAVAWIKRELRKARRELLAYKDPDLTPRYSEKDIKNWDSRPFEYLIQEWKVK